MTIRNLTAEERRECLVDAERNYSPALDAAAPTLEDMPLYRAFDSGIPGYGQTREEAKAAVLEYLKPLTEPE